LPVARADGADLHFEVGGIGPRLLFVNGSGITLADSRPLIGAFASRFELLVYDYRGLGRSSVVTRGYAMADCAGDAAQVMDAAGWTSAAVVGISFGGMVGLELAVSRPERIERLALLCTSAGGGGGSSYPLHELEGLDPEDRTAVRRTLMDTRFDAAWLVAHPDDRALVDMMEARAPGSDHPRPTGIREQLEARRTHDTWDRLATIACPTFIGCGAYDGIAPLRNSEAMASRIEGAELHVYRGGHAFLAQDGQAFGDVLGFLQAGPG
jgi:pimeloyl-ACP methyl ester carboxylesterase